MHGNFAHKHFLTNSNSTFKFYYVLSQLLLILLRQPTLNMRGKFEEVDVK